jgi:hypothetical protein
MAEFTLAWNRLLDSERPGAKRLVDVIERLGDNGVIVYGDSQLESELYETAVALEDELRDYFSFLRVALFHNPHLRYMRLFPPGARSPVVAGTEGAQEEIGSTAMRRRGNAHVAALALALRAVYQQKITVGADLIGAGVVSTSLEEVYLTMKTRLDREPAATQSERKACLRELEEAWRVISVPIEADLDDRSTRLSIRPMIADLISESVAADTETEAAAIAAGDEGTANEAA